MLTFGSLISKVPYLPTLQLWPPWKAVGMVGCIVVVPYYATI